MRKTIIPSAEIFEAPRERKEDPKPGMSNVKVRHNNSHSFVYNQFQFGFLSFSTFADLLPDSIWHDLCDSFCRFGHFILSKAKGIITKTVVMPPSIHRDINRPSTNYTISLQYDKRICTKPNEKTWWLVYMLNEDGKRRESCWND